MRTFIIRARKVPTRWEKIRTSIGEKGHIEIVAHCVLNAFFLSKDFRKDTEVYVVLDSAQDFPKTIRFCLEEGLSLAGFHEQAVLALIEKALKESIGLQKNETLSITKGLQISGFGFEKLLERFITTRKVYLLEPRGTDIRATKLDNNPVFILSDHIALPEKIIKSLKKKGLETISLGKKMLFASQCVVLLQDAMDRDG